MYINQLRALFGFFFFVSLISNAQVFTIGTGTTPTTGTTITPYKTYWHDGRAQYLIRASELLAAGSGPGSVTALAFNVTTVPGQTMNDFTIKMAGVSATALTSTFMSPTSPTTVMGPTTVNITATGWYTHTFATPFVWNGVDNILIDVCFDNTSYTTDGQVMSHTASFVSTTNHNTDGAAGCSLTGTGSYSNRPNMQLSITPATACVSPINGGTTVASATSVCPNQNFNLTLTGQTLASGLTYQWETSSSASGPWTAVPGATSFNFAASQTVNTYYRCVVNCAAASASGASTPVLISTLPNLAAGTYTIGSGGTYPSFTAAFAAASCGVAGPVVFQVLANSAPFVEQIEIGEIPGMSATNTITVKGNNNTLSYTSTNGNARHVLYLNGADYLRFEDLVIHATGTTTTEFGWALRLNNNANFNTFKRCIIKTSETLASTNYVGVALTTSATSATGSHNNTANNLTIDSCQILGGYYGVCLNGTGLTMGTRPSNNKVTNSTIADFYIYGIYAYGQNDLQVEYNNINRATRATVSTFYAMYNYGRNPGFKFNGNRIHSPGGSAGTTSFFCYLIYGSSLTGTAANPVVISNNAVYNINNNASGYYGMYMLSADTINILHNTLDFGSLSHTSGTSACYATYFSGSLNQVNFKNNIISISSLGTGAKYGIYNATTTALINSNNNALVFSGAGGTSNFVAARSSTVTYATFSAWNAATGMDSNSTTVNPFFINPSIGNVEPRSWAFNNLGANVSALVPLDLNRIPRSSTPDIGAIEFTPTGCPDPHSVQITNVRATGATVSYVSNSPSVQIEWGPKGFTPGTGASLITSLNSVNLSNLQSYYAYDVYVSGSCNGQMSFRSGPYSFETPAKVGWLEPFSFGYNPQLEKPKKWTEFNALATSPTASTIGNSAWTEGAYRNTGTTSMKINVVRTANNVKDWTITPSLDLGNVAHTTYFEWDMAATLGSAATAGIMGNDDTLFVLISTNNGTTWNRNQALAKYHRLSGISPTGGRYSLNLSAYTGLVKIAFYIESTVSSATHGATDYDLFIDNVALSATQTPCPVPNVTVTTTSNSATLGWTVNGNPVSGSAQIAWGPAGFIIGSGGSGANTATATTNPYTLTGLTPGTQYQIYIQTSCATALGQWVGPFTFNTPCLSAMSGAYTIDSNLATSATNFKTISAAVQALQTCGVSGPVTLNLAGYVHPAGLALAQIPGASATNLVTFQSAASGTAEIKGAGGQAAAVTLMGTKYVKVQNLRINGPTMSGVLLTDNAKYITIHNNTILADTTGTSSLVCAIVTTGSLTSPSTYGNNANNITITNNVIKGGYYGIRLNGGSTTSFNTGFTINNNQILKSYYYGAYFYYIGGLTMHGNTIKDYRNTFSYGIYAYYVGDVNIQRNNVPNPYYYGLILGYLNNTSKPATKSVISNNMFGSTNSYAAYLPYPRHADIHNNTFAGSTYGYYALSSTTPTLRAKNLDVRNNIFKGGSYAYYQSGTMDSLTMNYNFYQSTGANLVYFNSVNFSNLSTWRTAVPAMNANSVEGSVVFVSATDFHLVSGPVNIGTPIPSVNVDIDNEIRSALTPDIGADETGPCAIGITGTDFVPDTIWYGGDTLQISANQGFSGTWSFNNTIGNSVTIINFSGKLIFTHVTSQGCLLKDSVYVMNQTKLFVSTSGNDNNNGRVSQPIRTIQAAIDFASNGDTILVAPGTYSRFIIEGKRLNVFGLDSMNRPVISGYDTVRAVEVESRGVVLKHLSLRNGNAPVTRNWNRGGLLFGGYDSLTVRSCDFKDGFASQGGDYYGGGGRVIFINCSFLKNTKNAAALPNRGIFFVDNGLWLEMYNSVVEAEDFGSVFMNGNTHRIFNSTILNLSGNLYTQPWSGQEFKLVNSIVTKKAGKTIRLTPDTTNLWNGWGGPIEIRKTRLPQIPASYTFSSTASISVTGCDTLPVYFANAVTGDFRLSNLDEHHNIGDATVRLYRDANGMARPDVNGKVDLGAFESNAETCTLNRAFVSLSKSVRALSQVTLKASGRNITSVVWSTGQTGATINVYPNQTRWYTATLTDASGCTHVDSIKVDVANVTFRVDLRNQPTAVGGPHLAGSWNNWVANSDSLTQVGTSTIYERTFGLVVGDTIQYKFINGSDWATSHDILPATCGEGPYGNRKFIVGASATVLPIVHLSSCTQAKPVDPLPANQPIKCIGVSQVLSAGPQLTNVVWNTGDTTNSITIKAPGTYWFTAKYPHKVVVLDTTVVANVPSNAIGLGGVVNRYGINVPVANPSTVALCPGNSLTLSNFSTGSNYLWNSGATTSSLTVNSAGTHYSMVQRANGCWDTTASVTVTMNAAPDTSVVITGPLSFCSGGQVTIAAASGQTYLWSTGSLNQSITLSQSATPFAIVSTAAGCIDSTRTLTVTRFADPDTAVVVSGPLAFCPGGSVTLTAASGLDYQWNTGDTTQSTTVSMTGTAFAVVTTVNGCVDTTASFGTTRFAAPDTSVIASGPLSFCPGSSVTLTAVSGLNYYWSTGDTTQNVTLNQSGTTYAVLTTPNGCTDTTASFVTTLFPGADTTITASKLTFCASDSSVIIAAGGQSYLWNTGDTTQSITVNQTGNYAATVTTVNGCVGVTDTVSTTVVPDVVLPQILGDLYGWFASGDTVNFSVANTGGYQLTWGIAGGQITAGQGSDTVEVIWGAADSTASIWVVVSNGVCQDSAYLNLVISGMGNVDQVNARAMAFPNPNTGVFTLEWSNIEAQQVVIYNGVGQVVRTQKVHEGGSSIQMDLRGNAAGIYRAVIYGKDGQVTLPVYVRY
jgi:hypothetical protein